MENQTADYHGDVYQWNYTVPADEENAETEYYLPNWTDLVLAGLFTMLIIVTIVSNRGCSIQSCLKHFFFTRPEFSSFRSSKHRNPVRLCHIDGIIFQLVVKKITKKICSSLTNRCAKEDPMMN